MADRNPATFASLAAIAAFLVGADAAEPTAAELLARIDQEGGGNVLRALWAEQQPFEYLCARISTAEPAWLDIASKLKPFSDAGASLSLTIAMAHALPRDAAAVLTAIEPPWRLEMICGAPFIEPPPEELRAYLAKSILAVSRPFSPSLEEKRIACLYHLHTIQKKVAEE